MKLAQVIGFRTIRAARNVIPVMERRTLSDVEAIPAIKAAWQVYSQSVYNRVERGIGWILLSIGAMIILFFSGYQIVKGFIEDPSIPLIVKGGILAGVAGVAILLVSVVRERLFVNKRERYREIEK